MPAGSVAMNEKSPSVLDGLWLWRESLKATSGMQMGSRCGDEGSPQSSTSGPPWRTHPFPLKADGQGCARTNRAPGQGPVCSAVAPFVFLLHSYKLPAFWVSPVSLFPSVSQSFCFSPFVTTCLTLFLALRWSLTPGLSSISDSPCLPLPGCFPKADSSSGSVKEAVLCQRGLSRLRTRISHSPAGLYI